MSQVSNRVEEIFAHAVAMDQAGRLRSTIYVIDREVYIINQDNTVFLRFKLRESEKPFEEPVSFRANDYDSRAFREEGGKIVFETEANGFIRTKTCGTPDADPEEIRDMFKKFKPVKVNKVKLSRDILPLLEEGLSHIEIRAEEGEIKFVQRNIYSGAVIEISRAVDTGALGVDNPDELEEDFGPLGLRTGDFSALFAFNDNLVFTFPPEGQGDYCCVRSRDPKMAMDGVVACCVYDELGQISEVSDGRKEQKKRGSQQGSDKQTVKGKEQVRKRVRTK